MNIHVFFISIFICLSSFCKLDAQGTLIGNEKYNHYKQVLYIDNLELNFIPDVLNEVYYSQIDETKLDVSYQEIDTIHQERRVFAFTRNAKDGYLLINRCVMNRLKEMHIDEAKISYVYNDKIVSNSFEVNEVLNLKAKNVCISNILYNIESKTMSIYFLDK